MRLIDADAIIYDEIEEGFLAVTDWVIDAMPTIDAVPVIRCKDCKYFYRLDEEEGTCDLDWTISRVREAGHFCSWAERKDNEID